MEFENVEQQIIMQKIKKTKNLPAPSEHVMKVMMLLRDENVRADELVEAISKDQSLVAQILKLVNSGYYGLRKTIHTVQHAVNLLGILNVKQVVYSASIMEVFGKDEQAEWRHSYSSSVMMTQIMKENEIPAASNLSLSMLMHDIGKIILRRFSPKKYELALNNASNQGLSAFQSERALFHVDHAEVGAWLLDSWDMTEDIVIPIKNHHSEEIPEQYPMETALVQFVNYVDTTARGFHCPPPAPELLMEAGFEVDSFEVWVESQAELIKQLDETHEPLKISDTSTTKIDRKSFNHPASGPDAKTNVLANMAHIGVPEGDKQPG